MSTLYRKYRPQSFTEVCGQKHIKLTLENEIKNANVAHSYLFCGPRAVGKTTIARLLAKSLNCETRDEKSADPCNECVTCKNITEGKNIDVVEIDAASHTGVDNVRENIIAAARISTTSSKYKVFIVDEVHMLSISAFNALLKILEEPPQNVVFILCTTEIHKIPATIISRCERFDFKRISIKDMTDKLIFIAKQEKIEVEETVLRAIAKHAGGHMRDAESLFGQVIAISDGKITTKEADLVIPRSDLSEIVSLLKNLSEKNASNAIALINRILDEGIDLKEFASDLVETLRKLMLVKINPVLSERVGLDFNEGLESELVEIGKKLEIEKIVNFIEKFIQVRNNIRSSFITQLPFEIAIAEICAENSNNNIISPSPVSQSTDKAKKEEPARIDQASVEGVVEKKDKNIEVIKKYENAEYINISLDEVLRKWHEVIAIVKQRNNSLVTILGSCQIKDVQNGIISMVFKYKFHKDRIDDVGVQEILLGVFGEVFGGRVGINTAVDENMEVNVSAGNSSSSMSNKKDEKEEEKRSSSGGSDKMLDGLLKTFGGKVVG